ncbi:MAG: hypothetical protein H7231_02925, partial [Rhodoferax sp.]|nr:hypothetical protein [Actinomycetota bacterium]
PPGWARGGIAPPDAVASIDYRELHFRLVRPVRGVGYDSRPPRLLAATGGADWFIAVKGLYARRQGLADRLVGAYPARFSKVFSNDVVDVYRVEPPA